MRIEGKRINERPKENLKPYIYISGGLLVIAIIAFAITYNSYSKKLRNNQYASTERTNQLANRMNNNTTQTSIGTSRSINEVLNNIVENTTIAEENSIVVDEDNIGANAYGSLEREDIEENFVPTQSEVIVIPDPTFIKPVEGTILREYAMEKLIYSLTLKESILHPGIDIKAEKTTVVKAADGRNHKIYKK